MDFRNFTWGTPPLARYAEMPGVEVHVVDIQVDQLPQPDAGAQEQLDDEPVPAGERRGPAPELLEQPSLLRLGQEARRGARQPPQGHRPGRAATGTCVNRNETPCRCWRRF